MCGCCESREPNDKGYNKENYIFPDDDQFALRENDGIRFYE